MKNFFIYIVSAFLLTACACGSDDILDTFSGPESGSEQSPVDEPWPWGEGVSVEVPDLEIYGDQETTRALTYNLAKTYMKFSWKNSSSADVTDGDCIGVFPVKTPSSSSQQQRFVMTEEPISVSENSVTAQFKNYIGGVKTVDANTDYVSYFPYVEARDLGLDQLDYSEIPVTYLGQTQNANVNMRAYYTRTENTANMQAYEESEPFASEHLEPYDYLVSNATSSNSGNIHFFYTRLGSTVRFFIQAPDAIVYDSLHLVNKDAMFTTKATMNVQTKTLTPTKQSHAICLNFNPAGFDMSLPTTAANEHHYRISNGKAYMIAYMMLMPIELTSFSPCFLYLTGHVKDHPEQKKYFRSASLGKYDVLQNKTLHWNCASFAVDEPITFTAISVEEWKSATYSNGEVGKGTEGW